MARSTPPALMTIKDAADELRVSTRSVYNYVDRGLLPAHCIAGHLLRIRREDFEKFLGEPIPAAQAKGVA